MSKGNKYWLGKLGNLNTARTTRRGIAPHKPLMLLTLLDMAESGLVHSGIVPYGIEITHRFRSLWPIVLDRQQNAPDIRMPFYALGSHQDQIWKPLDSDGRRAQGKLAVHAAQLSEGLSEALTYSSFRRQARHLLIATYFEPKERVALFSRYGLRISSSDDLAGLSRRSAEFRASQKRGRSAQFKSEVVCGYHFMCALTGYRLITDERHLVQAAHIHQHAKGGANRIENGLALSPNAHWMFDQGLWTVGHDLKIIVAGNSFLDEPAGLSLRRFADQPVRFHHEASLRPDAKHLDWHRDRVFLGHV